MGNLTALAVKNAKPSDKLGDGDGLRLDVDKNGNASWLFRFKSPVTGKERFMGLGPLRDVGLADAREAKGAARAGRFAWRPKAGRDLRRTRAAARARGCRKLPTMLAWIGVMQALHRHDVREFSNRKETHWASGSWSGMSDPSGRAANSPGPVMTSRGNELKHWPPNWQKPQRARRVGDPNPFTPVIYSSTTLLLVALALAVALI
jgi:hypothetical protein